MEKSPLTVRVCLDAALFRDFALFDTMRLRRAWRSPVLFALILLVAAAVCFALRQRAEGAALLAGVLALVGLGLPVFYFLSFFLSLRGQIKKLDLAQPKEVYTLTFGDEQVSVSNGREETDFRWDALHRAYRRGECTYLYAAPGRAFLLPHGQVEGGGDALWALLGRHMDAQRLFP